MAAATIQPKPRATAPARMAAARLRSWTISFHTSKGASFTRTGKGGQKDQDAENGEHQGVHNRVTGHRCASIQARQPSRPSPVVQETCRISIPGCTRRAFSRARSAWNGT